MARLLGGAAEYSGQHAVLPAHFVDLHDRAYWGDLRPAGRHYVGFSLIAARLGYVEAVLGIHMREQGDADVPRAKCGFDDPEPRKRMLPLARQPSNGVGDLGGAFGAVEFACDDVALHVEIFRAWGLNAAPDAATTEELLYIAKEKRWRPDICSAANQTWGKVV